MAWSYDTLASAEMTTRQPLIVCLVIAAALAVGVRGETNAEYYAKYEQAVKHVMEQVDVQSSQGLSTWDGKPVGSEFNCPVDPDYKPSATNVNELTPYDIKVVGAIGDSITAAFGAKSSGLIDLFNEYRGISWSIGGDEDLSTVTTLPNIIKKYNPDVKGFSVGIGNQDSANARFNRAVSAAKADAMLGQAEDLVRRITSDETINVNEDWKLVTLWIGGNDLCQYCNDENLTPENYVNNIKPALDYFHDNLPRTFVNVVQIIDVQKLSEVTSIVCEIMHGLVCPCKKGANEMSEAYQKALDQLIEEFTDKDDFAVVLQPFMEGIEIPRVDGRVDMSYFAPDCFHFSVKGHSEGAIALWNNMIEPVGKKDRGWDFKNTTILCPDKYFYTKGNSASRHGLSLHGSNPQQQQSGTGAIVAGSVVGVVMIAGSAVAALIILTVFVVRRRQRMSGESIPLLDS